MSALLALDFTEPIFRVAESTLCRTRMILFVKSMSATRSPSVSPIRKPSTAVTARIRLNVSGAAAREDARNMRSASGLTKPCAYLIEQKQQRYCTFCSLTLSHSEV